MRLPAVPLALALGVALALGTAVHPAAAIPSPATMTTSKSLSAPVPTIAGTRAVGRVLSAVTTGWTAGTSFKYQWYRGGAAIRGATGRTYTLVAADRGAAIRVKVTGSKPGYVSTAKTSGSTVAVAAGVLSAPVPKITGTAVVGGTLTASAGSWPAGTAIAYQWYRSGTPVPGATGRSHLLGLLDEGAAVTVRVTGSRAGYATKSVLSSAVKVLAPSQLGADQTLAVNQSLRSSSGRYTLVMQSDGNLVEYGPGGPVWASGSSGGGLHVTMQSDGNLVVYTAGGSPRWASGSDGYGPAVLMLQDDGNLVVYKAGAAVWSRSVVGWIRVAAGARSGSTAGTQSMSGATLNGTQFRVYPPGSRLAVVCGVTNGQPVDGAGTPGSQKDATWHRLIGGDWVPDADFITGVDGLFTGEPACEGSGTGGSSLPGINGWIYPIQPHGRLTTYSGHNGDDFPVPVGTPVYAMYGGTVSIPAAYAVTSKWCPVASAIGRTQTDLIVTSTRDGHTYRFDYAHMSSFAVRPGQTVQAGTLLGYSGEQGCVTGPHLHVDIQLDGKAYVLYPHDLIGWSY